MRQVIIAAILLSSVSFANAQDPSAPISGLNYGSLEKKLKKSDEAITDEKDKVNPKTWFSRGELFQDIHDDAKLLLNIIR